MKPDVGFAEGKITAYPYGRDVLVK